MALIDASVRLVHLIILILMYSKVDSKLTRFKKSNEFRNHTCLAGDLIFSTQATSVASCLSLCAKKNSCLSAFYNRDQEICNGCSKMYYKAYEPQEATGFEHFHIAPGMYLDCYHLHSMAWLATAFGIT